MPVPMSDVHPLRHDLRRRLAWSSAAIVACVYPALMWWYLSRPPARAACMKQPEPEKPEPDLEWETTV